ncbi:peptidoglycan DD-metalloendopeptidase family protein [Streptomyces sp. NPDC101227]|uniref:peptidoglycan DD-metalloendopeptidase family protein n=1 Tax=Streptomyces sp. NPDC101227 TaxID=3366136 RepID=UPI0037F90187
MAAVGGTSYAATQDQWDAIAQCESGNDWSINYSGDGLSVGGLQFQNASWRAALQYLNEHSYDTSTWAQTLYQGMPRDQVPTKKQTILASEALLAIQGPAAWVCKGQGLSASMFDGGPTPSILLGQPEPSSPPVPAPRKPHSPPSWAGKPKAGKHTVRPGDTLYGITKLHTGNAAKDNWKPLYEANRDRIKNPDLIFPGQVLNLPWTSKKPTIPAPPKPVEASADYVMPVDAPITQPYGNRRPGYTLGYHTGIDITAPQGTKVRAATHGVVVNADPSRAYGINVQIKNADGTYSLYAHLSAKSVRVGQAVKAGETIGYVGSTGTSSSPHLHFEIRVRPQFAAGSFVDPADWLRKHGVTV